MITDRLKEKQKKAMEGAQERNREEPVAGLNRFV